ncbi:MAG: Peptidase S8 and S53 subtilisin kexin sedolisin, partial [candidate division WS6 bacterium GW2011_GWA2_37_6]
MKGVKFLLPIMFLTLIFALAGILVFNPKGGNKKESNGFQPNFDVDIPDEPAKEEISISFKDGTKRTEIDAYFKSINAEIIREIKPLNTFIIKTSTEPDALPESTEIAYKEQNFYIGAMGENGSESKEPLVPNDPLFKDQWAFQAINTEDLWNKVLDQEQNLEEHATIVAVIDSGICSDHPELSERVIEGYDFIDDDNQPQDALGHGCGVAGVIAANTNNTIGIASFAPNAKILPIKVLNEKGIGTYSDLAAGIVFAVDRKADIINLSLGGYEDSELLREAVGYATDHNVKIIAAAGNTGNETVLYPAKYEEVTAVGSVDNRINEKSKTYETSTFSSRGKEIDIWAPGSEILTLARDGDYQKVNGTSFAASVVTAVMANNDLGNFKAVFEKPNIEQTKQNTISKTQNLKLNFSNIEQGTDIPDDLQKVLLSEIQLWPLKVPESREFNVGSMRLEGTWGIATIVPVLSKQELENMESLNSSYSLLFSFNGTTWEASFKGGENIDKILTNISDSELPSDIKDFYKKSDSITAQSNSQQYMNYKMPWHQSKAFPLTQGWHANHFENELSSSLDFGVTQGNQILSSGPGIVSQVCKNTNGQQAWIIISTKEGATIYTDKLYYLHIKHNTMPSNIQNGASVNTGIVLGEITGAVTEEEGWPCPMKSTGAHLHFATNFGPKELAMGEYDFTATELPSGNLTSTNSDNAVSLISPSQNYPVNRYLDPSTAMNFAWNVFEKDGKIAEKYHIAAADNTAFSNPFFSLPSLISTSYSTTLGRFGDSEEVYWKVKACYENCQDANPNNYVWSDWSEVRKIKLIVPTPVINSPANNAIVDDALTININKGNLYGHDSNILYEI